MSTAEPRPHRHKPAATRWAVVAGLVFMAGVGMVLLFLLTLATRNRALYEQNFAWLVGINTAVAGVLLLVILWLAVRLALRFKRGKFGSRFGVDVTDRNKARSGVGGNGGGMHARNAACAKKSDVQHGSDPDYWPRAALKVENSSSLIATLWRGSG